MWRRPWCARRRSNNVDTRVLKTFVTFVPAALQRVTGDRTNFTIVVCPEPSNCHDGTTINKTRTGTPNSLLTKIYSNVPALLAFVPYLRRTRRSVPPTNRRRCFGFFVRRAPPSYRFVLRTAAPLSRREHCAAWPAFVVKQGSTVRGSIVRSSRRTHCPPCGSGKTTLVALPYDG